MQLNSESLVSLTALLAGAMLVAAMYRVEKRPRQDLNPRLFPTTLVMLAGLIIAIGAAVHLAALAGFVIPQRGP